MILLENNRSPQRNDRADFIRSNMPVMAEQEGEILLVCFSNHHVIPSILHLPDA
jgi:hypothetical protein